MGAVERIAAGAVIAVVEVEMGVDGDVDVVVFIIVPGLADCAGEAEASVSAAVSGAAAPTTAADMATD